MKSVPFVRIDFLPGQCNLCCHKGQLYTPAPILRPWPTKRFGSLIPMLCMGCAIKWQIYGPSRKPQPINGTGYVDVGGVRSNWRSTQRAAAYADVIGGTR